MTRKRSHIVNVYEYTEDSTLNILKFPEMTEEWLDFIVACRRGIEHNYDIVEGPQIVFCTEKAISTLQYERSYPV